MNVILPPSLHDLVTRFVLAVESIATSMKPPTAEQLDEEAERLSAEQEILACPFHDDATHKWYATGGGENRIQIDFMYVASWDGTWLKVVTADHRHHAVRWSRVVEYSERENPDG